MIELPVDLFSFDSHIHTAYSGHADQEMTVQSITRQMQIKGLEQIAITEHVFEKEDLHQIAVIASEMALVGDKALLGAEIDADSRTLDGKLVASAKGMDWVIASFHKFPGTSIWWHDRRFRQVLEERAVYDQWVSWVHRVISVSKPDALGHLGVLICRLSIVKEFDDAILQDFREILASCRQHGVALELNEGASKKMTQPQRDTYYRVFQLAKEAKVKIVLASDSHSLAQIGHYVWTRDIVGRAGIEIGDCIIPARKDSCSHRLRSGGLVDKASATKG